MAISKLARKKAKKNNFALKTLRNSEYKPVLDFQSWLVQILLEPGRSKRQKNLSANKSLEYGWGAGSSGLDPNQLSLLNKICYFKYMGSHEFEGGQLGRSFNRILTKLGSFTFQPVKIEGFTFYLICESAKIQTVEKNIRKLIVNNQFKKYAMTKDLLKLDEVLVDSQTTDIGGWDIQNDYIYFLKEKPFNQFKKLINALPEVVEIKRLLGI